MIPMAYEYCHHDYCKLGKIILFTEVLIVITNSSNCIFKFKYFFHTLCSRYTIQPNNMENIIVIVRLILLVSQVVT